PESERFAFGGHELEFGFGESFDAHHRNVLKISATAAGRIEAVRLELIAHVLSGQLAALLPHAAAFEFIAGEILDVGTDFFGVDALHRGTCGLFGVCRTAVRERTRGDDGCQAESDRFVTHVCSPDAGWSIARNHEDYFLVRSFSRF